MKIKHTPGKWEIDDFASPNDIEIWANGTPKIAILPNDNVSINEWKANARLIAAAPKLLAACEEALLQFGGVSAVTDGQKSVIKTIKTLINGLS